MRSSGNENVLRQETTIYEGAQIRVNSEATKTPNSENTKTPTALFLLLGVCCFCCFLQMLVLVYLGHCRASLSIEILKRDQVIEERTEKTATRAALEALDRYMGGKRSGHNGE